MSRFFSETDEILLILIRRTAACSNYLLFLLQGRTGTMICAYLLYKRMFNTPERALEFFYSQRMLPGTPMVRTLRIFAITSLHS